jgi:hypothetical protein
MILTLILFGLVFGRWWRSALIAAAVSWPVLLVVIHVMSIEAGLLGASALAVINAAVGVFAHQVILRMTRQLRANGSSRSGA